MRDFFINSFEGLVSVIIVLAAVMVTFAGVATLFSEGFVAGVAVLLGGALYVVMLGGFLYLALGIYHNTRRTAEAAERLASK